MASARENSVEKLQGLYSVVAGLSLTLAVQDFLTDQDGQVEFIWKQLPILVAFLATLVPFYHGALRHLDFKYLESPVDSLAGAPLLADFALLFLEGCVLVALSRLISLPVVFAWVIAGLMIFDSAWALMTHGLLRKPHDKNSSASIRWASINLVAGPTLAGLAFAAQTWTWANPERALFPTLLLIVCLARTVVDYRSNWRFYFP